MAAKDPVPHSERRRGRRTSDPSRAATACSTAAPQVDPHLIPFLDLLGSLIADHIVAEAAAGGGGKVELSPSLEATITPPPGDPANSGPIPTSPPDSPQTLRPPPAG